MQELFDTLHRLQEAGTDAVLVTVAASSGSTPRGSGAKMIVTRDGRIYGTIGGGMVEYTCEQTARGVLANQTSRMERYALHANEIQDLGMICGGDVEVFFRYIPGSDPWIVRACEDAKAVYQNKSRGWLVMEVTSGSAGNLAVVTGKETDPPSWMPEHMTALFPKVPSVIKEGNRSFYCERIASPDLVYIFGGGHVAQALVPVLADIGFSCIVCEDREEFARPELFRGLAVTRLVDNDAITRFVDIEADYVVIMTRGHANDERIQAQVLKTPAKYIGVIGSRRKKAGVFANLKAQGFTDADLARITTPIGLDIGAETPAEIAVSIAAQLILVRAQDRADG